MATTLDSTSRASTAARLSLPARSLAAIQAFLLYLVLRMLGLTRLVAGSAALLLDIGLFIDTTRVWPQNALLTVDTSARTLNITPTYYVFRHLSQFVAAGAKVVEEIQLCWNECIYTPLVTL